MKTLAGLFLYASDPWGSRSIHEGARQRQSKAEGVSKIPDVDNTKGFIDVAQQLARSAQLRQNGDVGSRYGTNLGDAMDNGTVGQLDAQYQQYVQETARDLTSRSFALQNAGYTEVRGTVGYLTEKFTEASTFQRSRNPDVFAQAENKLTHHQMIQGALEDQEAKISAAEKKADARHRSRAKNAQTYSSHQGNRFGYDKRRRERREED